MADENTLDETAEIATLKVKVSWWIRLYCFIRGHNFIELFKLHNLDFGGQSHWGQHKCMRCGREENWQYDF